jgi:hypothetical protein
MTRLRAAPAAYSLRLLRAPRHLLPDDKDVQSAGHARD